MAASTSNGSDDKDKSSPDRKRQSTLDESNIDVPDKKKIKTESKIPEKVKKEDEPDATESVQVDTQRKKTEHESSTLQKGLIYFFYRPKVDQEKITSAVDAQRAYIVLRPLPEGAEINDDTKLEDIDTHLIELPKKVLPQKGDQFMAFVAKGKAKKEDIQAYLSSSTYSTKTRGERTTPAARPSGQGVYCLADIKNSTHLAYKLTTPSHVQEVQDAFGINEEGSFVLSTKNPESNSYGAQLPGNADFPKDLQDEFGSRSWLPLRPEHLEYEGAGLLFIGKGSGSVGEQETDETLQHLEEEDESRESLKQIFTDLGISLKEHESKTLLGEFA